MHTPLAPGSACAAGRADGAAVGVEEARRVFAGAAREVERILGRLDEESADTELAEAKRSAAESLQPLRARLEGELQALDAQAEWDTFTIAFYGETNAGKSTLIEALRIALGEHTKLESRRRFRELHDREGLAPEDLDRAEQVVAKAQEYAAARQSALVTLQQASAADTAALQAEVATLEAAIARKRSEASLWQKLLGLLRPLPEVRLLSDLHARAGTQKTVHALALADADRALAEATNAVLQATGALARRKTSLAELAAHADGAIIGNGQSDFTLEATEYRFEVDGQRFALVDVPGIEGKEARVMDAILGAVRKAHAVFYVTDKAAPPQKGGDRTTGTLEKIKAHLGAHTEVRAVYNKRATNPAALPQALVGADERAALDVLDATMRAQLGDAYEGHIVVSAKPAFLAVAECLVPGSPDDRGRAKFLARMDGGDLLERSNLVGFRHLLEGELVQGHERKIRRSNYNKARTVVEATRLEIDAIRSKRLVPMEKRLEARTEDARVQLHSALKGLRMRLDARVDVTVDEFASRVRKAIYKRIEGDIGNDEFRQALESVFANEQAWLEAQLPTRFEQELGRLQAQIGDVVERLQEQARDLAATYARVDVGSAGQGFELKIDIDNGLKIGSLVSTLLGGVLLWWNPGGWVLIAIGVLTALVGLGKAVIGYFSSDYKMAQQRKAADENIVRAARQIRESLHDSLREGLPVLERRVDEIDEVLGRPLEELRAVNRSLRGSLAALGKLSRSIQTQGKK